MEIQVDGYEETDEIDEAVEIEPTTTNSFWIAILGHGSMKALPRR